MNTYTTNSETLWPVLPPDDRIPLTPAAWTTLNIVIALLISMPFFGVAGSAAVSVCLVDAIHALLNAHVDGGIVTSVIALALKGTVILFAMRLEYLMVAGGGVRFLVRELRHAVSEFDPSCWL